MNELNPKIDGDCLERKAKIVRDGHLGSKKRPTRKKTKAERRHVEKKSRRRLDFKIDHPITL
jgi:hypothetical protein